MLVNYNGSSNYETIRENFNIEMLAGATSHLHQNMCISKRACSYRSWRIDWDMPTPNCTSAKVMSLFIPWKAGTKKFSLSSNELTFWGSGTERSLFYETHQRIAEGHWAKTKRRASPHRTLARIGSQPTHSRKDETSQRQKSYGSNKWERKLKCEVAKPGPLTLQPLEYNLGHWNCNGPKASIEDYN